MDSCGEKRLSFEDGSASMPDGEARLREMIELVYPLVSAGSTPAVLDISEDIMLPAARCGLSGLLEIEKLCAVCSLVLGRIGNTILTTLAAHVATLDGERTLKTFLDEMQHLVYVLGRVYDTSRIEAFRLGLSEEFDYGTF